MELSLRNAYENNNTVYSDLIKCFVKTHSIWLSWKPFAVNSEFSTIVHCTTFVVSSSPLQLYVKYIHSCVGTRRYVHP